MAVTAPLYLDGLAVGQLDICCCGLWLKCTGTCPAMDGLWRCRAIFPETVLELGVMEPDCGSLRAERTFSVTSLRGLDPEALIKGELYGNSSFTAGWREAAALDLPTSDPVIKAALSSLPRLLVKAAGEYRIFAAPWNRDCPFPLTPVFCFCRVEWIKGCRYAVLKLSSRGLPCYPSE